MRGPAAVDKKTQISISKRLQVRDSMSSLMEQLLADTCTLVRNLKHGA